MKVILTDTIGGLGRMGDVVVVADGYARNYLVPKRLAVMATKGALKEWEQKKNVVTKKLAQESADAQALADMLNDKEITIAAKSGEGGKLYGSVTSSMIADAIVEQQQITIDKKKIEVEHSLKELGAHPVKIKLHAGVEANMVVNVVESTEE